MGSGGVPERSGLEALWGGGKPKTLKNVFKLDTLFYFVRRYLSFFLEPGRLKRLIGGVGSSRMSFHQCRSSSNDCFRLCAKNNVKHCVKVFYARSSLVGANKKPLYAIYIKRNQKRAHALVLGVAKLRVLGWNRTQTEWARMPINQLQSTKNIGALELHVSLKPLGLMALKGTEVWEV